MPLESRVIQLIGKIASTKRKHNLDRKSLPKTSALRCSKCEGYGHGTHQYPNCDASPMTNEDLKNYILYLKEEEERTMQKLDVLKRRQEHKLKRVHEKETLIENEVTTKREKEEKETRKKREKKKEKKREKETRKKREKRREKREQKREKR